MLGVAALAFVFFETRPGKRILAQVVARKVGKQLHGQLVIGEIRGNILTQLTLANVVLLDAQGHEIARIANIVSRHRLELQLLRHPRLVVRELTLEQPEAESADWGALLKSGPNEESQPSKPKSAVEFSVHLEHVRVVAGRFDQVKPINADFRLPAKSGPLPTGQLMAGGWLYGLPLKISASVAPRESGVTSISGVVKGKPATSAPGQSLSAVASLGSSAVTLAGSGVFDLDQLMSSAAVLEVSRLHLEPSELRERWPGLPRLPFDGRGTIDLADAQAKGLADVRIGKSGHLVVAASASGVPRVQEFGLERLELNGKCALLKLKKPVRLKLVPGELFPQGELDLAGCAGAVHYVHGTKAMALTVKGLRPNRLFEVFSLHPPGKAAHFDLGMLTAKFELPRGPEVAEAFVNASWHRGVAGEMVELQAQVHDTNVGARLKARVDGQSADLRAELSGVFKPESWTPNVNAARGRIEAHTSGLDLGKLYEAQVLDLDYSGKLSGHLIATGSLAQSKVHLEVLGSRLGKPGLRTSADVELNADYDSKVLKTTATMRLPDSPAPLVLNGELTVSQERLRRLGTRAVQGVPLRWQAQARDFNVASIVVPDEGGAVAPLRATLEALGAGTLSEPRGQLHLELESVGGHFLSARGKIADGKIEASISSKNALTDPVVSAFTNLVRTENGRLDADLQITGELARPVYRGLVHLHAPRITLPLMGTGYQDFDLLARGDMNQIDLESLTLRSGSGNLKVTGALGLAPGQATHALTLNASFENLQLLNNELARAEASGLLVLKASRADDSFSGSLDVSRGRIETPDTKGRDLEGLGALPDVVVVTRKGAVKVSGPGLFDRLHGAIAVNAPGQLWIGTRDKTVNIEVEAKLEAGLHLGSDFFLTGQVKTRRGEAEFFGRRFILRPSVATFRGDVTAPVIAAEAVYEATPWNIVVALNGDVRKLKPQLTSDPPGLREEQAVGVLLTGNPDFQGSGGSNRGVSSLATGVATGYLVGQLREKLGSKLPFDTLTADVANSDNSVASSAGSSSASVTANSEQNRSRVEVGKYLTDRIFVKIGHVFSSEDQSSVDKLMLEYRLSNRWSIETTQTDQGRSDLEVLWTINY